MPLAAKTVSTGRLKLLPCIGKAHCPCQVERSCKETIRPERMKPESVANDNGISTTSDSGSSAPTVPRKRSILPDSNNSSKRSSAPSVTSTLKGRVSESWAMIGTAYLIKAIGVPPNSNLRDAPSRWRLASSAATRTVFSNVVAWIANERPSSFSTAPLADLSNTLHPTACSKAAIEADKAGCDSRRASAALLNEPCRWIASKNAKCLGSICIGAPTQT